MITFKYNFMSVRNSRPRTQTNHIFAEYNNQRIMLCLGSFQTKEILYSTRKKLLSGKIEIPILDNPKNLTTIMITCSKDEPLKFEWL